MDPSYFQEKAEQCLRLARDRTDQELATSLTELAVEYTARAAAIEATIRFREDPNQD